MPTSSTGKTWRRPVRSDHGGERVSFWANSATQAALQLEASRQGLTVNQTAKRLMDTWAESHKEIAR